MFLKKEKPELDDFEEKNFDAKVKYLKNVLNGYPCKNVTKYFCISFVSEHS